MIPCRPVGGVQVILSFLLLLLLLFPSPSSVAPQACQSAAIGGLRLKPPLLGLQAKVGGLRLRRVGGLRLRGGLDQVPDLDDIDEGELSISCSL